MPSGKSTNPLVRARLSVWVEAARPDPLSKVPEVLERIKAVADDLAEIGVVRTQLDIEADDEGGEDEAG